MGLLVIGYVGQLADVNERASASFARARIGNFVDQVRQSSMDDGEAGVALHLRATRLFSRFGGVFFGWASRFYENRRFELAFIQQPDGRIAVLSQVAALAVLGGVLWLLLQLQQWLRHRLAKYANQLRHPSNVIEVPLNFCWSEADSSSHSFPNRVCNTRVLCFELPLKPARVCLVKFLASLVLYFGSPDDFFFLFVAFGQVMETGSFRSCGPVMFFCAMFCTFEAIAALRQARQDSELNSRTCTVLHGTTVERVLWSRVQLGCRIRLLSGETPPCDLLISHVHGSLRAREKDLTGESKPVVKQNEIAGLESGQVRVLPGNDEMQLSADARRLGASAQLFRGTTITLSSTDSSQPFVEGVAVRLGHQCKMHRECAVATQRPSLHLERMSLYGMVLVTVLLLFCYDNTLTVFSSGNSHGRSFAKVFF